MLWWIALLVIGIGGILYYCFLPGIEDAKERRTTLYSKAETELAKEYRHEASYYQPKRFHGKGRLYRQHWLPHGPVQGNVLLIHGLNDHSGRLIAIAKQCLQRQLGVYTMDFEGFGRSSGRHGYFEDLSHLVEDVLEYIDEIKQKGPEKLFLFGGSMGGLIIVHSLLQNPPIDGAIIQCPAITIHEDSRPHYIIECISKIIVQWIPKIPLVKANKGKNSSPSVLERNEAEKAADPLFYSGKLRIGTGIAMLKALEAIQGKLEHIDVPFLLQHGEADRVCHLEGSEEFFKVAKSKDKTFKTYADAQHDLLHEPEEIVRQLTKDWTEWIESRVK